MNIGKPGTKRHRWSQLQSVGDVTMRMRQEIRALVKLRKNIQDVDADPIRINASKAIIHGLNSLAQLIRGDQSEQRLLELERRFGIRPPDEQGAAHDN